MPQKALDQDLVAAIRKITNHFILSREGTPQHIAKTDLGKKHNLLEEAIRSGYLQSIGPKYFPCFLALELEDPDSRRSVEQCTTLVFRGLRAIYEREGERMCIRDDILKSCRTFDPNASEECVSVGMLFATNFSSYVPLWGASPPNESLSLNLQTSARLLEFDDVLSAWKQELTLKLRASAPRGGPGNAGQTSLTSQSESKLIFLSHAARDQGIAIYLKKIIEEAIPSSNVFVSSDTEDLRPGDEWVKTIRENLREAKMLLLLASKRGLSRPWVWYETGAAWSREIRMIPCCLGKVKKNGLSAPFSSYQALNADEAGDFRSLLTEIGRELRLPIRLPEIEPVVSQLQALDRTAHETDASMLTPEEVQPRVDATNVSAKIREGFPDAFSVLLTNESAESVLVREIRLIGPKGIALTEPYVLPPESRRTIEPHGRLQVDWKPQSDPTVSLIRLSSPGGWPSGKSRIEADLTIEVGCEVLKRFKKCPTNRQVQVDVLNRRIDDSW
jgi:TIR domain-containing protein